MLDSICQWSKQIRCSSQEVFRDRGSPARDPIKKALLSIRGDGWDGPSIPSSSHFVYFQQGYYFYTCGSSHKPRSFVSVMNTD